MALHSLQCFSFYIMSQLTSGDVCPEDAFQCVKFINASLTTQFMQYPPLFFLINRVNKSVSLEVWKLHVSVEIKNDKTIRDIFSSIQNILLKYKICSPEKIATLFTI
jgi:hypothetical protein